MVSERRVKMSQNHLDEACSADIILPDPASAGDRNQAGPSGNAPEEGTVEGQDPVVTPAGDLKREDV